MKIVAEVRIEESIAGLHKKWSRLSGSSLIRRHSSRSEW